MRTRMVICEIEIYQYQQNVTYYFNTNITELNATSSTKALINKFKYRLPANPPALSERP